MSGRLSHKAIILTIGNGLNRFLALFISFFLVRVMSQHDFGTYRQIFLIVTTCAFAITLGIPSSIYYFYPRLKDIERKSFLFQTFGVTSLIGLIGSFIVLAVSGILARKFDNPLIKDILSYFAFYVLFSLPNNLVFGLFITIGKPILASIFTFVFQIAQFFITIISITVYGLGVQGVLMLLLFLSAIQAIASFFVFMHYGGKIKAPFRFFPQLLRRQISYSVPLGLSSMVGFMGREIDKFIISFYFLPSTYAVYSVGALEVPFFFILTQSITSTMLPKMVEFHNKKDISAMTGLWKEAFRKCALISFPLSVLLIALAYPLVTLMYTDDYAKAVNVFRIYQLLIPLRSGQYSLILQAIGKTRYCLIGSILFIVFNVGLNLLSIAVLNMGIYGPPVATVIAIIALCIFFLVLTTNILNISILELIPLKELFFTSIAAGVSGVAGYYGMAFVTNKIVKIIIYGIASVPVYLYLLHALKVLTNDDKTIITDVLRLKFLKGHG